MRKLKTLGVAFAAVFAITAIVASVASAQFESEAESTTLKVTSNEKQTFTYTEGGTKVICNTVTVSSTVKGKTTETVEAIPTYTGCEELFFFPVSIDTNGCAYVFHLVKGQTTGTTDIKCPEGSSITVTVGTNGSLCKLHIGSQTGLSSVTYSNVGSGSTSQIKLTPSVKKIKATRTGSGLCGPETSETGTYSGSVTVKGESGGKQVGIKVD